MQPAAAVSVAEATDGLPPEVSCTDRTRLHHPVQATGRLPTAILPQATYTDGSFVERQYSQLQPVHDYTPRQLGHPCCAGTGQSGHTAEGAKGYQLPSGHRTPEQPTHLKEATKAAGQPAQQRARTPRRQGRTFLPSGQR